MAIWVNIDPLGLILRVVCVVIHPLIIYVVLCGVKAMLNQF